MKLHHIGLLTKDIAKSAAHLCESCGYEIVSEIIEDPIQTASVQFLKLKSSPEFLELISPLGEKSKLQNALKKGVVLHHMCYQTDDIHAALENYKKNGFYVLCEPVDAAAFPFRKIAWVMDFQKNLFELVESTEKDAPLKV